MERYGIPPSVLFTGGRPCPQSQKYPELHRSKDNGFGCPPEIDKTLLLKIIRSLVAGHKRNQAVTESVFPPCWLGFKYGKC